MAEHWYEDLRGRHRPDVLRVLLVAESPPDPGGGGRRFFYSSHLASADNLYRGVAEAVYGTRNDFDVREKTTNLERLRSDGFWLIDAVDFPINKLPSAARKRALAGGVPRLVQRCVELAPRKGVIICHGRVFAACADDLRTGGVCVLHDEPLPFPLGNWRAAFIDGFRRALARSDACN